MSKFVLSCCSTADLSAEHFALRNISVINFHFSIDGVEYTDDLGKTVPFEEFYARIREGAVAKTSQVNAGEFLDYFENFCLTGQDVLHISTSSGISGEYRSAVIAANELAEKYPNRKIIIIDSLGASSGYGLLMDYAADRRDEGMSIDETAQWIEENKLSVNHWFFSTDLTSYIRGGRISPIAGLFGGVFNICPLLNMDHQGKLVPKEKIRTKKRVITAIVNKMVEHASNGTEYNGKCYISHSDCIDDARSVVSLIESQFPNLQGKVLINNVGTTIGSHTGVGTIALFFIGEARVEKHLLDCI